MKQYDTEKQAQRISDKGLIELALTNLEFAQQTNESLIPALLDAVKANKGSHTGVGIAIREVLGEQSTQDALKKLELWGNLHSNVKNTNQLIDLATKHKRAIQVAQYINFPTFKDATREVAETLANIRINKSPDWETLQNIKELQEQHKQKISLKEELDTLKGNLTAEELNEEFNKVDKEITEIEGKLAIEKDYLTNLGNTITALLDLGVIACESSKGYNNEAAIKPTYEIHALLDSKNISKKDKEIITAAIKTAEKYISARPIEKPVTPQASEGEAIEPKKTSPKSEQLIALKEWHARINKKIEQLSANKIEEEKKVSSCKNEVENQEKAVFLWSKELTDARNQLTAATKLYNHTDELLKINSNEKIEIEQRIAQIAQEAAINIQRIARGSSSWRKFKKQKESAAPQQIAKKSMLHRILVMLGLRKLPQEQKQEATQQRKSIFARFIAYIRSFSFGKRNNPEKQMPQETIVDPSTKHADSISLDGKQATRPPAQFQVPAEEKPQEYIIKP